MSIRTFLVIMVTMGTLSPLIIQVTMQANNGSSYPHQGILSLNDNPEGTAGFPKDPVESNRGDLTNNAPNGIIKDSIGTRSSSPSVFSTRLEEGWNLISIPLNLSDTSLSSVLQSIDGKYDAVRVYDAACKDEPWKTYNLAKPGSLCNLYNVDQSMGFWIHVNSPSGTTLTITDNQITTSQDIAVRKGWNLLGYPSETPRPRYEALNNLDFIDDLDIIQFYNATEKKWHEMTSFDSFEPGRGYWIHAKRDTAWTLPLEGQIEPLPLSQIQSWAYQLQMINEPGVEAALVSSSYDMLVLEPTRTDWSSGDRDFDTKGFVESLKASNASDGIHRKLILAYIDIGEAEDWRWYWTWSKNWPSGEPKPADWPDFIICHDPDGWEGNYPVAYWDEEWKDIIIYGNNQSSAPYGDYNSAIDEAIKDGFDGIYIDWVEAYENLDVVDAAIAAGVDPAIEMVNFISEMRTYASARNPDFLIIQQNAAQLGADHSELFSYIDGLAQEAIWFDGDATDDWNDPNGYDIQNDPSLTDWYITNLEQYLDAGLPVFNCEYALVYENEAYSNSYSHGYIPYVTRRSLSQLTSTPPPGPDPYPDIEILLGFGNFTYHDDGDNTERPVNVYYYRPDNFPNGDSKVVFTMHGSERNAVVARDRIVPYADRYNALLIAPEFSTDYYPDADDYNRGFVKDGGGTGNLRARSDWTLLTIEELFDIVRAEIPGSPSKYSIQGNSGAGQFISRIPLLVPEARFEVAAGSNSGWYTLPMRDELYPNGIGDIDITDEQIEQVYSKKVVVVVGELDTDPYSYDLKHNEFTDAQGINRYERALFYYDYMQADAAARGVFFNWDLIVVEDVEHPAELMAHATAGAVFTGATTPADMALPPIDDTYIDESFPSDVFGASLELSVDGGNYEIPFLKFDLGSVAAPVNVALLRLYITNGADGQQFVYEVADNSWTESSLTWNTAPALGKEIGMTTGGEKDGILYIEVTDYINERIGGLASLAIQSEDTDSMRFSSKEASYFPVQLCLFME